MIAFYCLTAFLAGAGVLVVEMTAPRALAPYFGQAQFVWANVIGTILLALALGNLLGARLADRGRAAVRLGVVLIVAAVLVAGAAFLPAPVSRGLLPGKLPLEAAWRFLFQGSLLTTFICFAPPVLLLGAVPPLLIRCATRSLGEVGRRSGQLYGASTFGSIAGTFLTSYVLVPELGTRCTLLLAAALLISAAVAALLAARREAGGRSGASAATAAVVALVVLCGFGLAIKNWAPEICAATPGAAFGRLVVARESRYQHIEVRERDDLPVPGRVLAIDEGHDSVQSVTPARGVLTGLYYDYLTLLALDAARLGDLRIAILGFGGGTHAQQILHYVAPRCSVSIVGVELDPGVIEVARQELGLKDDPRLVIHVDLDARTFVDHAVDQFDLIIVDCYNRQSFLPPHVASREFFGALRARLTARGIVALNLFGYGAKDPVVEAVTNTLASALDREVAVCMLPRTANLLVYAQSTSPLRLPGSWLGDDWPEECRELLKHLKAPAQAFRVRPGSEPKVIVLTDDCGTLDRLQEERLRTRAASLLKGSP